MSNHIPQEGQPARIHRFFRFHPYLLAIYPILSLYAHNIREVEFSAIGRSLLGSVLATTILLLVFLLLLRDFDKASSASSLLLILVFSYGHVYALLKQVSMFNILIGRHRILAPLWLGLCILGLWWITRKLRDPSTLHRTLSIIMLIALAFPMVQMVDFLSRTSFLAPETINPDAASMLQEGARPEQTGLPDIHYIILDGYTRADTLLEMYAFDNQPFLQKLERMGFYVASCSQSNYAQTMLSLASSLNFVYPQSVMQKFNPGSQDFYELWVLIKHSATQKLLESMGYYTIAFETGFYWSQLDDAEIYLRPSTPELNKWQYLGGLNNFEVMLFKSTLGLIVADGFMAIPKALAPDLNHPDQKHRNRVLFALDELERMPDYPGPKFVFAHIVSPHPPYVFGPDGQFAMHNERESSLSEAQRIIQQYTDQVTYINLRMERILDSIISSSERPPLIIIQADHGTNFGSRLNILNAYYFPGLDRSLLYESITPVNTFRLVFSQYFDMDLPLLQDQSYMSSYSDPYAIEPIPNLCQP